MRTRASYWPPISARPTFWRVDPSLVTAVATAAGAPLSHASILVRSLGIPLVTGLGEKLLDIPPGTFLLVAAIVAASRAG